MRLILKSVSFVAVRIHAEKRICKVCGLSMLERKSQVLHELFLRKPSVKTKLKKDKRLEIHSGTCIKIIVSAMTTCKKIYRIK